MTSPTKRTKLEEKQRLMLKAGLLKAELAKLNKRKEEVQLELETVEVALCDMDTALERLRPLRPAAARLLRLMSASDASREISWWARGRPKYSSEKVAADHLAKLGYLKSAYLGWGRDRLTLTKLGKEKAKELKLRTPRSSGPPGPPLL